MLKATNLRVEANGPPLQFSVQSIVQPQFFLGLCQSCTQILLSYRYCLAATKPFEIVLNLRIRLLPLLMKQCRSMSTWLRTANSDLGRTTSPWSKYWQPNLITTLRVHKLIM